MERGDDVAGEVLKRGSVPVASGGTDTALVVAEHRKPAPHEKAREGQQVFTILGAGGVDEDHRRMLPGGARAGERAGEPDITVRESDVFASFDGGAPGHARAITVARPDQRRD